MGVPGSITRLPINCDREGRIHGGKSSPQSHQDTKSHKVVESKLERVLI